jgi:hypothetical protein
VKKKLLEFQANISDIVQVNPLFSSCQVRVLYTGKNPNLSIFTKESVENALPSLKNIPIVGEFVEANNDFKGHGGAIDLDTYKYIHTTKPYGVVPESATYDWEEVKGKDGVSRDYLTIQGCYLWTGRYEEAQNVIENGKSQSMEIEVVDGEWDAKEEAYRIDNFLFSALTILGDDVEPAFSEANITAYSLNKDSFKQEFSEMLKELKFSLSNEEEVEEMDELLKKYSITVEDLKAKNVDFEKLSEDELEAKIKEAFEVEVPEIEVVNVTETVEKEVVQDDKTKDSDLEELPEEKYTRTFELSHSDIRTAIFQTLDSYATANQLGNGYDYMIVSVFDNYVIVKDWYSEKDCYRIAYTKSEESVELTEHVKVFEMYLTEEEKLDIDTVRTNFQLLTDENKELKAFKLESEKADHEEKAKGIFNNFQLKDEDVEGIDIHSLSIQDIEEKCYAILGRKLAKKNFAKIDNEKDSGIRLPISSSKETDEKESPYGDLFNKYKK